MNTTRLITLAVIVAAGLVTLFGSSLEERTPRPPPVPVTVDYALSGPSAGLSRETGTLTARLDNLDMGGSYASEQGQVMTLDRTALEFASGSSFSVTVIPKDDELLEGTAAIEITAPIDIGLSTNPVDGQFTSLFDGTSTVVTVVGGGVDVITGSAVSPQRYNWSEFRAFGGDDSAPPDTRMAATALNMLRVVLRAALLAEDLLDDVETHRVTLEGMNVGSSLEIDCDNTATDGASEARLIWTSDAVGAGQGSIGSGDDFEARYRNCLRSNRGRFLEGDIIADNYSPAVGDGLRSFGINADLRNLFVAESTVNVDTTPSDTAPRYDGQLTLRYQENAVASSQQTGL